MKRILPWLLVATIPLFAQAAPVCVDPEQPGKSQVARGGIGGTGAPAQSHRDPASPAQNGGGIGGTGAPAAGDGGIGGTGMPVADGSSVGIVGVISGFASVCINGVAEAKRCRLRRAIRPA